MTVTSDRLFAALDDYHGDPFTVGEWAKDLECSYAQMSYAMKAAERAGLVHRVQPVVPSAVNFYQKTNA